MCICICLSCCCAITSVYRYTVDRSFCAFIFDVGAGQKLDNFFLFVSNPLHKLAKLEQNTDRQTLILHSLEAVDVCVVCAVSAVPCSHSTSRVQVQLASDLRQISIHRISCYFNCYFNYCCCCCCSLCATACLKQKRGEKSCPI